MEELSATTGVPVVPAFCADVPRAGEAGDVGIPGAQPGRAGASPVLITGGSGGIGLELARCFAAAGHDLILAARTEAALHAAVIELSTRFTVGVAAIGCDLSTTAGASNLVDVLRSNGIEPAIVVNNAGFGIRASLHEAEPAHLQSLIGLNFASLAALTREFLPGMLRRGQGGILNVASTAGFQPGPYMAAYFASKAYVVSLTEALHEECKGSGVAVSCLCPGPTHTGFARRASNDRTWLFRLGAMTAADVARRGYVGFKRNEAVVIPGIRNRVTANLAKLSPRRVVRRVAAVLNSDVAVGR